MSPRRSSAEEVKQDYCETRTQPTNRSPINGVGSLCRRLSGEIEQVWTKSRTRASRRLRTGRRLSYGRTQSV